MKNSKFIKDDMVAEKIINYLEKTGWKQLNNTKNGINIFQYKKQNKLYQATVLTNRNFSDYNIALQDSITSIASKEELSEYEIIKKIENYNSKILRIRLIRANYEDGNISLDDAINLYKNLKKILLSTILDIKEPKIYHVGRISEDISSYLKNCRFGQTEIGSYVATLVIPNNIYVQQNLFEEYEFGNQIINKIFNNIRYIKSFIDEKRELQCFYSNKHFVSINFIEALRELNLKYDETELEFYIDEIKYQNKIKISNMYYRKMGDIIKKFKSNVEKECIYIGKISQIKIKPFDEKQVGGNIQLAYIENDDKIKKINIEIDGQDYNKAIFAFKNRNTVKITIDSDNTNDNAFKCNRLEVI